MTGRWVGLVVGGAGGAGGPGMGRSKAGDGCG